MNLQRKWDQSLFSELSSLLSIFHPSPFSSFTIWQLHKFHLAYRIIEIVEFYFNLLPY